MVQVVRAAGNDSKRPVTVDTAIRIDLSSLQGCTTLPDTLDNLWPYIPFWGMPGLG